MSVRLLLLADTHVPAPAPDLPPQIRHGDGARTMVGAGPVGGGSSGRGGRRPDGSDQTDEGWSIRSGAPPTTSFSAVRRRCMKPRTESRNMTPAPM